MKVNIGYCEKVIFGEMIVVFENETEIVFNVKKELGFSYDIWWISEEPYNYRYDGFFLRDEYDESYAVCQNDFIEVDAWNPNKKELGFCEIRVFDSEVYNSFISFDPEEFLNCLERKSKFFSYEDNNGNTLIGLFLRLNNYNQNYIDRLLRMKAKFSLKCLNYMIRLFQHFLVKMKEYGWFENPDHLNFLIFFPFGKILPFDKFFTKNNPEYLISKKFQPLPQLCFDDKIRLELQNLENSI